MMMLSRLNDDSKHPTSSPQSTPSPSNPRSELGKFRSSSPSLQKSYSGSALSSLLDNASHHIPVYIPGQHSELSTAFLHKHKRGGPLRKHGDVISVDKPFGASSVAKTPNNTPSPTATPTANTTSLPLPPPTIAITSASINSKPYIPIIDDSSNSVSSTSISSPSLSDNDSDNITIKASPSSSDDDDDSPEANHRRQQKMIRKKSGELVKSSLKLPSLLRTQSMPTKMVHFDSNLEHVRKFFRREKPTAVSSGSATPVKERVSFQWASGSSDTDSDTDSDSDSESEGEASDEDIEIIRGAVAPRKSSWGGVQKKHLRHHHKKLWQIALPNFSGENKQTTDKMVYLDSVFLSSDNSNLIGHICVKNTSFRKSVGIRYTIDFWKTVTEVVADYNGDVRRKTLRSGYDRFTFSIRLSDLPQNALTSNSMFFCVRYQCDDGEFWDNNDSLNYEVLFTKVSKDHKFSKPSPRKLLDDDLDELDTTSTTIQTPRQAYSYFMSQPHQSLLPNQPSPHHRNGGLKHHHRRTKTDPSPDFLYDNDFDHHHTVADPSTDLFEGLSISSKKTPSSYISNGNSITNTSNLSPTKKSNGLTSRYSFGASLNAALAKKNMTGRRPSYDGDADEEITTSESTSDDESTDTTPSNTTHSDTTPQLRSFIFPKSSINSMIRASSTTSISSESRPAWDSMSYKDIISKYCFFQDTPTTVHHSHHRSSPAPHRPHHRPTGSFIASPMTTSPALIPQSSTPPILSHPTFSSNTASPLLAAAASLHSALASPPESPSSTLSTPSPTGSFSPSPTDAPASPGESSSDTLLDVSEPRKIWHSVEV